MTIPAYFRQSMHIDAPPARVWKTLTDPTCTPRYMFGCELVTDWTIGGRFDWKGAADGVTYVKGYLRDAEPDRLLRYTVIDAQSGLADIPANHLTMTVELVPERGGTTVQCEMGDYTTVGEGETRYRHTVEAGDGWLERLKEVAEG